MCIWWPVLICTSGSREALAAVNYGTNKATKMATPRKTLLEKKNNLRYFNLLCDFTNSVSLSNMIDLSRN